MSVVLAPHSSIADLVKKAVFATPVHDIHTHLYEPAFGDLLLWGIDDLLTYHYLVAEFFRVSTISYDAFWGLDKVAQADLIWNELFVMRSPLSEACRGVVTTLQKLGIDSNEENLASIRSWFSAQKVEAHVEKCLRLAGVESVCMTNSPFDAVERAVWQKSFPRHPSFRTGLRIDPLLLNWPESSSTLIALGYNVTPDLNSQTIAGIRKFLEDWTRKISPLFLMVSLPPSFNFPDQSVCNQIITQAVLPHCRDFNLPFALMPGVRRAVNPELRLAGDGIGHSNIQAIESLCVSYPKNKFLVTVLGRENQHELCIAARKFRNLHIFGCWWFTNIPILIDEITRLRLELLGSSFTAQHSDARVMDQVIYKWTHTRSVVADVLAEKYQALAVAGWDVSPAQVQKDVAQLFGGAFHDFCRNP